MAMRKGIKITSKWKSNLVLLSSNNERIMFIGYDTGGLNMNEYGNNL